MNTKHPKKRPQGIETRGKTAINRLRRVDNFVLLYDPHLLIRNDLLFTNAAFVDLGYGFNPKTTLESATRFRRLNPNLPVIGIEIVPERVAIAQPFCDDKTDFRLGGFNIPLESKKNESIRLIRAFNVLRQYQEEEVSSAYELLAHSLLPNGLLVEGTSDPYGRIWVAHILRRTNNPTFLSEYLVFSSSFKTPFHPKDFQTILPKNLIHRVTPGEKIYRFFEDWKRTYQESLHLSIRGERQVFIESIRGLAKLNYPVVLQKRFLNRGYLLLRGDF